jgi:hypothetical protein
MPRGTSAKPRLVEVSELPKTVRRGVYVTLVEDFAKSGMKIAKVEGVKVSAALSIRKAVANLGLKNITVSTTNGEVYLSKK